MPQVTFLPNGAGDLTEFPTQVPATGAHWDKVDEAVADDGTTYVEASYFDETPRTQVDLYSYLPSILGGKINWVRVYRRTYDFGYPPGTTASVIRIASTNYSGTSAAGTDAWTDYYHEWTVNPATSSSWDWSTIYAMQFGYSQTGTYRHIRVTKTWMVVDYDEDVAGGNIPVGDFGFF